MKKNNINLSAEAIEKYIFELNEFLDHEPRKAEDYKEIDPSYKSEINHELRSRGILLSKSIKRKNSAGKSTRYVIHQINLNAFDVLTGSLEIYNSIYDRIIKNMEKQKSEANPESGNFDARTSLFDPSAEQNQFKRYRISLRSGNELLILAKNEIQIKAIFDDYISIKELEFKPLEFYRDKKIKELENKINLLKNG